MTLPLPDTEFSLTPFNITSTQSPPPSLCHIPDPSDIDHLSLRNRDNPTPRKSILIPTSINSFRRRPQFDHSLPIPPPCFHLQSHSSSSIHPPKAPKILALESFDSFQKKSDLSGVDSTTFSLIYQRLPHPPNSASKYTTSCLDNLLETTSEPTIRPLPRHIYNLRNNRHPTPSLASTNCSLLRRHAQSISSDSLSIPDSAPTSGVDTAFSQRPSISAYKQTGHLFSQPTSGNPSALSSDTHLLDFDLTTDQYSTPPCRLSFNY